MAMKILKTGQVQLETDLLAGGTLENWTLRLYQTSHAPAVTDTLATYTAIISTFTGYSDKTLTRTISGTTWATPTTTGTTIDPTNNNSLSTYHSGTPQTWSMTGTTQTVFGYYWAGATSAVGILAEQFASSVTLTNPSTLNLTPVLELGSN
jgi:hypothetical protein